MAQLGKIFIYEQNAQTLQNFASDFQAQGFFAFGTDNIYRFLKYANAVHPDIVIMNIPENFETDDTFWKEVRQNLCHEKCPQIFINAEAPFKDLQNTLHLKNFKDSELTAEGLQKLLNEARQEKTLH